MNYDSTVFYINVVFVITVPCKTNVYQKPDGKYYCGFTVKDSLNWYQADEACKQRGGKLPEIYSTTENSEILKLKVTGLILACIRCSFKSILGFDDS